MGFTCGRPPRCSRGLVSPSPNLRGSERVSRVSTVTPMEVAELGLDQTCCFSNGTVSYCPGTVSLREMFVLRASPPGPKATSPRWAGGTWPSRSIVSTRPPLLPVRLFISAPFRRERKREETEPA